MQPTVMFLFLRSIIIINDNFCIYQRGSSLAAAFVLQYINIKLWISYCNEEPYASMPTIICHGGWHKVSKMTGYQVILRSNIETTGTHRSFNKARAEIALGQCPAICPSFSSIGLAPSSIQTTH